MSLFRRALTTAAVVAGLVFLGTVPFADAQVTHDLPGDKAVTTVSVATGGEPAEGAPGFLVLSGALLAAAASGGMVFHLRRRTS